MGLKSQDRQILETREDAALAFPRIADIIRNPSCCYADIFEGFLQHYSVEDLLAYDFPSAWAYEWTMAFGDQALMRDRITDSKWAYRWALDIGDQEVMRDRVTESEWAYRWALDIGNRGIMRDRVTESQWAYYWALDIGDQEVMRDRVTESEWAYRWCRCIGDWDIMRSRITESYRLPKSKNRETVQEPNLRY